MTLAGAGWLRVALVWAALVWAALGGGPRSGHAAVRTGELLECVHQEGSEAPAARLRDELQLEEVERRPRACVENKVARTLASWCSGGSVRCQSTPRTAPGSGQSRLASRVAGQCELRLDMARALGAKL